MFSISKTAVRFQIEFFSLNLQFFIWKGKYYFHCNTWLWLSLLVFRELDIEVIIRASSNTHEDPGEIDNWMHSFVWNALNGSLAYIYKHLMQKRKIKWLKGNGKIKTQVLRQNVSPRTSAVSKYCTTNAGVMLTDLVPRRSP